jgi:hypothetical protein
VKKFSRRGCPLNSGTLIIYD